MIGKVYLIAAGPGNRELLSAGAVRALRSAEVVFHDGLASTEILDLVAPSTQVRSLGTRPGQLNLTQEEFHLQLVSAARTGRQVVRLAGSDSLPEANLEKEVRALREAGIEFEVVPGIANAVASGA
jgi:siroheme synthase